MPSALFDEPQGRDDLEFHHNRSARADQVSAAAQASQGPNRNIIVSVILMSRVPAGGPPVINKTLPGGIFYGQHGMWSTGCLLGLSRTWPKDQRV